MSDEMECPCCGWVAAAGMVYDGQWLLCGCNGAVSVDGETDPSIIISDDPCPSDAMCNEGAESEANR